MRVVAIAGLLGGCAEVSAPERLLGDDPGRDGFDGTDGPFGVARIEVHRPARATGVVPVGIVFPADADLKPATTEAPIVLLVEGARVAPDRYDWLAIHLASRGYVVAVPDTPLHLAIVEPGDVEVAEEALRDQAGVDGPLPRLVDDGSPVAVVGHSLGGVVAARRWTDDSHLDGLILLASFAAGSDPVEDQTGRPVLALCGTEDQVVDQDLLPRRISRFDTAWLGFVNGMNHYSWTDDPTKGELSGDGNPIGDPDVLRRDALRMIDLYLDAIVAGDPPALGLPAPGIRWAF